MNKKKGMSQTLALIVAASVLMMTALTVIFLAQGALGDFGKNSAENACRSAIQSQKVAMSPGDAAQYPSNCYSGDGNPVLSQVTGTGDSPGCFSVDSSGAISHGASC